MRNRLNRDEEDLARLSGLILAFRTYYSVDQRLVTKVGCARCQKLVFFTYRILNSFFKFFLIYRFIWWNLWCSYLALILYPKVRFGNLVLNNFLKKIHFLQMPYFLNFSQHSLFHYIKNNFLKKVISLEFWHLKKNLAKLHLGVWYKVFGLFQEIYRFHRLGHLTNYREMSNSRFFETLYSMESWLSVESCMCQNKK